MKEFLKSTLSLLLLLFVLYHGFIEGSTFCRVAIYCIMALVSLGSLLIGLGAIAILKAKDSVTLDPLRGIHYRATVEDAARWQEMYWSITLLAYTVVFYTSGHTVLLGIMATAMVAGKFSSIIISNNIKERLGAV